MNSGRQTQFLLISIVFITLFGCGKHRESNETHVQAAKEVVELEFGSVPMERTIQFIVEGKIKSGSIKPEEGPAYSAWLKDVFSSKAYLDRITKLMVQNYTESELNEIAKFYSTKTGQKQLKSTPLLIAEINKIGKDVSEPLMPELIAKVEKTRSNKN